MNSAVLISAFNEGKTVARVVAVALEAALGEVLVVSDGSTDDTAVKARVAGASVLSLPVNSGKGAAVAAGARELVGTDYLVLLDADLIHLTPAHLSSLLEPILAGRAQTTAGLFSGGRGADRFRQSRHADVERAALHPAPDDSGHAESGIKRLRH